MRILSVVVMALLLCVGMSFAARGGTGSSSGSSSKAKSSSSSSSSGSFGIGYSKISVNAGPLGNVGVDQIAGRYWINDEIGLDFGLGFSSGDAEAAVLFSGKFLYSFINRDKLKVYMLAGIGFGNYDPKNGWNSVSVFMAEGGLGIEYFVIPSLSLLTEIGLRYGSVSANGQSQSQFNTFGDWVPAAGVRFYF